jgi:hypothetical protein
MMAFAGRLIRKHEAIPQQVGPKPTLKMAILVAAILLLTRAEFATLLNGGSGFEDYGIT